ncbi:MAG: hypothetical protein ACOC44_09965 [Promethearchaeia archaeon]
MKKRKDCPFCKNNYYIRGLYSHIRAKHPKKYKKWKEKRDKKKRVKSKSDGQQKEKMLTSWEENFLNSIITQLEKGNPLSIKQGNVLQKILESQRVSEKLSDQLSKAQERQKVVYKKIIRDNRENNLFENIAIMPKWGDYEVNNSTNEAFAPNIGPILIPENWMFVKTGNTARTRSIKKGKQWWVVIVRDSYQDRRFYKKVGYFLPEEEMDRVLHYLEKSSERRKKAREYRKKRKLEKLAKEGITYKEAVLDFLNFSPKYNYMAESFYETLINYSSAQFSFPILPDSTKISNLMDKVEIEIINHIRHNYTDYEIQLDELNSNDYNDKRIHYDNYWRIKARCNRDAWDWIDEFREH